MTIDFFGKELELCKHHRNLSKNFWKFGEKKLTELSKMHSTCPAEHLEETLFFGGKI